MVDRFDGPPLMQPYKNGDFVRYSDYAELEAEVERLTRERDEALMVKREAVAGWRDAEALSRTGAVKAALSGDTGELIDRMAAAIRDWGSHYDDGPWETLPEDRKAGWRGDAERALAVVKEYLTARRPAEQAVTDEMVGAAEEVFFKTDDHGEPSYDMRAALTAAMEARHD